MKSYFKNLVRTFALWLLGWVDKCPTCQESWTDHVCPAVSKLSNKTCDVCLRPLGMKALRTHTGKWRCAEHKQVEQQSV